MCRRRNNGSCLRIKLFVVNNMWVVPCNPYLIKNYNVYVNIEIFSSIKSIKYIFKYTYKSCDCATVVCEGNGQRWITWDKIKTFLSASSVYAPEAMSCFLKRTMLEKSHIKKSFSISQVFIFQIYSLFISMIQKKTWSFWKG